MAKLTPALLKVLEIVKLGVPVTPTEINDYVGAGNYASKHILYLKNSGYQFNVARDGRTVVSYTLTGIPADADQMIAAVGSRKTKKTVKVAKAPKAPKAAKPKAPVIVGTEKKAAAPKAPKKSVADIKAKNLAKLKAVGERFNKANKPMTDAEILKDEPMATSFSLDGDWDSVDGLDLSKLI